MKDLRFYGNIGGTDIDFTFRTDLINPNAENFSVSQIQSGNDFNNGDEQSADYQRLFGQFKRLPYNLSEFKAFAEEKNVNLSIADANGDNLELLVEADESVSE
jgi:hypothetical protein